LYLVQRSSPRGDGSRFLSERGRIRRAVHFYWFRVDFLSESGPSFLVQLHSAIQLIFVPLPVHYIAVVMNSKRRKFGKPIDDWVKPTEAGGAAANPAWLCAGGPYQEYIGKLYNLNPGFKQPDPENRAVPLDRRRAKATLLIVDEASRIRPCYEMESVQEMDDFRKQLQSRGNGTRNIWLVEGLTPELVATLGNHFKMDPLFFLEYERSSRWRRWAHEINLTPHLPSSLNSRRFFSIKYFELRDFGPAIESFSVSCADTGRRLDRDRWKNDWVSPSIVDRRCCYWSRETGNGGWDGMSAFINLTGN